MHRAAAAIALASLLALAEPARSAFFSAEYTVDRGTTVADGACSVIVETVPLIRLGCTLREAILEANATPEADVILLQPGVYALTIQGAGDDANWSGDLDVTGDVEIQGAGAGATSIVGQRDGPTPDRVLDVHEGATVSVRDVTLTRGAVHAGSATGDEGGAVRNAGTLALADCVVSESLVTAAEGELGRGGGVSNRGSLEISRCEIADNEATSRGGGISNAGPLWIRDSRLVANVARTGAYAAVGGGLASSGTTDCLLERTTIAGNTSERDGGGVENQGNLFVAASTISANVAARYGGGVYHWYPSAIGRILVLENTTLSDNELTESVSGFDLYAYQTVAELRNATVHGAATGASGIAGFGETIRIANSIYDRPSCLGADFETLGHNVFAPSFCSVTGAGEGDQIGVAPLLGALADNGGPTYTHALLAGSPAIDAGDPDGCRDFHGALLATDQRGEPRAIDGDGDGGARCDAGAFEAPEPAAGALAAAAFAATAGLRARGARRRRAPCAQGTPLQ